MEHITVWENIVSLAWSTVFIVGTVGLSAVVVIALGYKEVDG